MIVGPVVLGGGTPAFDARISPAQAAAFWNRIKELVHEFDQTPRSGDTVYGFVVGIYPTAYPTLPERETG